MKCRSLHAAPCRSGLCAVGMRPLRVICRPSFTQDAYGTWTSDPCTALGRAAKRLRGRASSRAAFSAAQPTQSFNVSDTLLCDAASAVADNSTGGAAASAGLLPGSRSARCSPRELAEMAQVLMAASPPPTPRTNNSSTNSREATASHGSLTMRTRSNDSQRARASGAPAKHTLRQARALLRQVGARCRLPSGSLCR